VSDDPTNPDNTRLAGGSSSGEQEDLRAGETGLVGTEAIKAVWRNLPHSPGVYRMVDAKGDILYVGKARDLKKRVAAYTKLVGHTNRIARMITSTTAMEIVTTHTETEALLLEANLIKRLRPRFNVILRDDKSFPYILIAEDHAAPQITKHRGARNRKGHYFGPFASANAVNRTLTTLQKAFLLRSCSDSVYESRTRPCLLHQIKRCAAPCTGVVSEDQYRALVEDAVAFLSGKDSRIHEDLAQRMEQAAAALDFETAAILRDRIRALSAIRAHQGINPQGVDEADVVAAHQEGGETCIQVFFFRASQNWGNRAYFPRHDKSLSVEEVLESFLAQFYDDKPPARHIYLSHDIQEAELLAEALSIKAERKITVSKPQRGEKRQLVEQALTNAREALGRRMAESASMRRLLEGVADAFGLEGPPERIEVYDNSHIGGTNAVGGMIVAGPEGFEKSQYRKFNIKSEDLTPGDDFGMMREVLTRRFARLVKETEKAQTGEGAEPPWPDLVLIDGGQGQLSSALEVMRDLGVESVPLVAIAKGADRDAGREQFFQPGKQPFRLDRKDPVLYHLQRLRDEAHRFAIGSHRARRKKDISANPLDEITGIGAKRKRALLNHFGSAKAVARAGVSDLERVEGVSRAMAQKIYDHFRSPD